jgi:ankyrin repeat protein
MSGGESLKRVLEACVSGDLSAMRAELAAAGSGMFKGLEKSELEQVAIAIESALGKRQYEAVRELAAAGAPLDSWDGHGDPPLLALVKKCDIEGVRFLLDAGASVDAKNLGGGCPLAVATMHGSTEMVRLLLGAGANLEEENGRMGETALMVAVSCGEGHVEVARLLIEQGANTNAKDVTGRTALMVAARSGDPSLVAMLLSSGAEIELRDNDGVAALDWARRGGAFSKGDVSEDARECEQMLVAFGESLMLKKQLAVPDPKSAKAKV